MSVTICRTQTKYSSTKNCKITRTKSENIGNPINDITGLDKCEFIEKYEERFRPPEFTIKELRECIPKELFEKSLLRSSIYTVINIGAVIILIYLSTFIPLLSKPLRVVCWPIYWWFQGIAGVGIWILAHECGHQAYSNYKTLNNIVGLILHSIVLVPYHSWRISHSQHHASTAHIELDQAFLPKRRKESYLAIANGSPSSPWREAIESSPIYTLGFLLSVLTLGWPFYFLFHTTGRKYPGSTPNHFLPSSPIFKDHQKWQILISDLGVFLVLGLLTFWAQSTSWWTIMKYYGIPYMIVNAWLITITLLQHTDVYIPHYSSNAWTFVRGALSTVDRDYGWFLNNAFHHINDSHVAHHLFSQMPFYNAIKATPYLKEKLGEYYYIDPTPVWKALYRTFKRCKFVEDDRDVLFYKNK